MLPVFPLMVSVTWLMVAMMVFLSLRVMAVLFSGGGRAVFRVGHLLPAR